MIISQNFRQNPHNTKALKINKSMDSLTLISPIRPKFLKPLNSASSRKPSSFIIAASSSNTNPNPLKSAAAAAILLAATSSAFSYGRIFSPMPAIACPIQETSETERIEETSETDTKSVVFSSETISSLKSLVYQKLEQGEDSEALELIQKLISYQPLEIEWKFLAARICNEMGELTESRKLYEEILEINPLLFEALFENAVLMDRCGEGEEVVCRLEKALEIAKAGNNEKSARDVRLIMAQIKYLQKNVDAALADYDELIEEDGMDYRPYFCQGVIYSFLEKDEKAKERFKKYKELAPKKFEVDAYLQTPLSRMKIGGIENSES